MSDDAKLRPDINAHRLAITAEYLARLACDLEMERDPAGIARLRSGIDEVVRAINEIVHLPKEP